MKKTMPVGFMTSNQMLNHQTQLSVLSLIYCSVFDPPEETQQDDSPSITYQGNYSILCDYAKHSKSALHTALEAQFFVSKPVQDISKLCLKKSLAIISADLNVNTVTADREEPSLYPSFGPLLLCSTDLDSAVLFLWAISSQWGCSEKRGFWGSSQGAGCPFCSMHNCTFSSQVHIYMYCSLNMLLIF